ncbi:DoxX family protein [Paenibacillus antri]|uniref:DoxX family protein n=1 Tax=Paenibacillus antri TaxID=2582848 RepID=A0A5R9G6E0_9BACL|nr:DoxX family protein [Paenibacillus antri]TLS51952.1 DoxX family protein [Paenibacillus antri]
MFNTFLRTNRYAAAALFFLRFYLGYQWFTHGLEKLNAPEPFNAAGFLAGAVGKATGDHPAVQGWWADFLTAFAIPNADVFSFLVLWGEILAGLGLMLGCFTTVAALGALAMNFAFLLSGTTSTNPQMAIMGFFVLVAGANAGRYGADRWVLPYLKAAVGSLFGRKPKNDGRGETPTRGAFVG